MCFKHAIGCVVEVHGYASKLNKCLKHLREEATALPAAVQGEVKQILSGTGCEELLS